jgi:hypothetical protein
VGGWVACLSKWNDWPQETQPLKNWRIFRGPQSERFWFQSWSKLLEVWTTLCTYTGPSRGMTAWWDCKLSPAHQHSILRPSIYHNSDTKKC